MTRVALLALPALVLAVSPASAGSMAEMGAAMSTNSALQSSSAPSAARTLKGVKGKVAGINAKQTAKVAAWDAAAGPGGGKTKRAAASRDGGWASNNGRGKACAWATAADKKKSPGRRP